MKILKLKPKQDIKTNHNYHVNYGAWDEIEGDEFILEGFNSNIEAYDVVFLPMYKRWVDMGLLNKIKNSKVKTVLFDNDSCYRTFNNPFYRDIDLILYRCPDENGNTPNTNSIWHPWSVDTSLYSPIYGGEGVTLSCSVSNDYPLRQKITKIIKNTSVSGKEYIKLLQKSGGVIHTDSNLVPMVRAKALEIASCGSQIISNRTNKMDYFFPDELVTYFDSVVELEEIIKNFKPNMEIQKELRHIVETRHDNKIRANEIIEQIKEIL